MFYDFCNVINVFKDIPMLLGTSLRLNLLMHHHHHLAYRWDAPDLVASVVALELSRLGLDLCLWPIRPRGPPRSFVPTQKDHPNRSCPLEPVPRLTSMLHQTASWMVALDANCDPAQPRMDGEICVVCVFAMIDLILHNIAKMIYHMLQHQPQP
jgi:hypothetical protein